MCNDRKRELREQAENAFFSEKNYTLAIKLYDELLTEYPNRWDYADKAYVCELMRQYKNAIVEYQNAIIWICENSNSNSNREIGYYYGKIAKLYFKLGETNKAFDFASKSIGITPRGAVLGNYDFGARRDLAAEHDKGYAYNDRAELLYKIQEYEMALEDINEALNEWSGSSRKILKAEIIIGLKRYEQLPDFIKDLDEVEQDYCLGLSFKTQNLYDKALEHFSKVLNNSKHSAWISKKDIFLIEAEIYETLNDNQNVLDVLKIYSEYCRKYDKLGDFYLKQCNYEKAIECYNKQLEKDAYDSGTYFNRCKAKNLIKDYKGAIEDLMKAIQIFPNNQEYIKYLQEIKL